MQMQFGNYIFKNNPIKIEFIYNKNINLVPIFNAGMFIQDLGKMAKRVKGESIFSGRETLFDFEKLVSIFNGSTDSKLLVLPNCEIFYGFFTKLCTIGDTRKDVIKYSFEFIEDTLKKQLIRKLIK